MVKIVDENMTKEIQCACGRKITKVEALEVNDNTCAECIYCAGDFNAL